MQCIDSQKVIFGIFKKFRKALSKIRLWKGYHFLKLKNFLKSLSEIVLLGGVNTPDIKFQYTPIPHPNT